MSIKRTFKFVSWNINGLIAKLADPDFVAYITSFDVCLLLETFTMPVFDFSMHFNEFIVLHSAAVKLTRMGRSSGGVIMLVKNSYVDFVEQVETQIENVLCLKLSKALFNSTKDVHFIGLYNHPYTSDYYTGKDYNCTLEQLEEFMLKQIEEGLDVHYLVGGDLNARIGDWYYDDADDENDDSDIFQRKARDCNINGFGRNLIQLCYMFKLTPLNGLLRKDETGKFTFISERGNSTIDLFLSSIDLVNAFTSIEIVNRIDSHHMPIELQAKIPHPIPDDTFYSQQKFDKIKWDNEKVDSFLKCLLNEESKIALNEASDTIDFCVDSALDKFVSVIVSAAQCMRRTIYVGGRVTGRNKWFDLECRHAKRKVQRALNKYTRTNRAAEKTSYLQLRSEYQKLIKEKKKMYKNSIQEQLLQSSKDSTLFWSLIKRTKAKKTQQPKIDLNVWKNHFERILGQHEASEFDQTNEELLEDLTLDPDLDSKITELEVRQAIRRLKSGKAPGLDDISGDFLKSAENIVTPFLTKLFNHLYDRGVFPSQWCKSIIIPLLKKGDPKNPENYRGISLLSTVSKVFTYILNKRLYSWAENEQKISEGQAGFRKGHATTDHIFTLISMIQKCLYYGSKRKKLYACFVDYQKAFDSVNRDSLWAVLKKVKTSTKMLKMIQGIYASVQSCVRWGSQMSDFFDCPAGVKQGCMLSPLIFSLLITEVADNVINKGKHGFQFLPGLQEIFLLLFADDICLISLTAVGLQNQINSLQEASDSLGLVVNLSKTKVIVFRKGGHLAKNEKWFYKGTEIEIVNSYKYLGFTLTTRLSFDTALHEFAARAKGKVVEIMRIMWRLGSIDYSVFFRLFDAQIKPMLLYASEIWGMKRYHVVEAVHLFACKRLLNIGSKTPNTMAYGEIGRYPLYVDSMVRTVRYWFKLQDMLLVRYPKQAYIMSKNNHCEALNVKTCHNWSSLVKNSLDLTGFSNVWINGGVANEKAFLRIFKQRLIDCYKQDWHSRIEESDRFEKYRTFKFVFQPENYLNILTIRKFRNAFIRFRLGLNELNINNRFNNLPQQCPFCLKIESEEHFLLECQRYADLRLRFISRYYLNAREPVLLFLLNNENADITRSVAMYIYYALKRRAEDTC
jgi:exonuclease III